MPRRPFPVFVLSVGFAVLVFTVVRPLFAQPAPAPAPPSPTDPPKFPEVRVEPAGGAATAGAEARALGRAGHADRAVAVAVVRARADGPDLHPPRTRVPARHGRPRDLMARPDPAHRRAVPDRQEHPRDAREAGT